MNLKRYFIYLSSAVLLLLLSACSPAPAQKGFLLALSSSQLNLFQGFGDEVAVQIMRMGGFSGAVELSIVGLPQEISASFSDSPTQANSVVLGLMTSSTIVEQSLTVTIKGSSEGLEHQVTLSLEVLTEFAQGSHPGYAPIKKAS